MFRSLLVFISAFSAGCLGRGSSELLESRLRVQEDRIYALESQLERTRGQIVAVQRENDALRSQVAGGGEQPLPAGHARSTFDVEGVRIYRWMTGGIDRDERPGDDALHVVLVPHDAHDEAVKLAGRVELELLDVALPPPQRRLGSWTFDAAEVRERWHNGVLAAGFQFELPWQTIPSSAELLLHARFTTADGRRFDASQSVRITPPESSRGELAQLEAGPDSESERETAPQGDDPPPLPFPASPPKPRPGGPANPPR